MNIKIPELDLEDKTPVKAEDVIENSIVGAVNYAFVGTGQGGGRIAEQFYNLGYRKVLCINTSPQDLHSIELPEKQKMLLDIGPGGAGKDLFKGEEAVIKYKQDIYDRIRTTFGNNVDSIILCASAGGGSGAGSLPPLQVICKKYMKYLGHNLDVTKRVGAILTLPTNGEAQSLRVAVNAYKTADTLSEWAEQGSITPMVIVDNNRIKALFSGLKVKEYWPTINKNIAALFDIFNRLSVEHSPYVSFDPSDYNSVITAGGHCVMGVTSIKSEEWNQPNCVSAAIKQNLQNNLFAQGFNLDTATVAAAAVVGGEKLFEEVDGLQDAIDYGFDALSSLTGKATVHRGIYQDDRESLRVYTIIGGLKRPQARYDELKSMASEVYP